MNHRIKRIGGALSLLLVVVLASCKAPSYLPQEPQTVGNPNALQSERLEVRFYGTMTTYAEYGEVGVFFDPFFTTTGMLRLGVLGPKSHASEVARWDVPWTRVAAVMISHGHYDHVVDLPHLPALGLPPAAPIVCSRSIAYQMDAHGLPNPYVCPDGHPLGFEETFHKPYWIELPAVDSPHFAVSGLRLRILAVPTSHPTHIFGKQMFHGHHNHPLGKKPGRNPDWLEGQCYNYVIDWLDDADQIRARLLLASVAPSPTGLPPAQLLGDRPADLAILGCGRYQGEAGFPSDMIARSHARHVIVGHWENFFRKRQPPYKPVGLTDVEGFIAACEASAPKGVPVWVLAPGSRAWIQTQAQGQAKQAD
jgi:hypothetical protein